MIQATVIIPAWNSESTLRASVESALAQTEVFIEIIVVDDCSTDGTRAVAGDLADAHSQVRALTLARNSVAVALLTSDVGSSTSSNSPGTSVR